MMKTKMIYFSIGDGVIITSENKNSLKNLRLDGLSPVMCMSASQFLIDVEINYGFEKKSEFKSRYFSDTFSLYKKKYYITRMSGGNRDGIESNSKAAGIRII